MKVTPFNNQALLEYLGVEDVTEGGLVLPENHHQPLLVFRVLEKGPGAQNMNGDMQKFDWIQPGMEVGVPAAASQALVEVQSHPERLVLSDMEWIICEVKEWRKAPEKPQPKSAGPKLALPSHLVS